MYLEQQMVRRVSTRGRSPAEGPVLRVAVIDPHEFTRLALPVLLSDVDFCPAHSDLTSFLAVGRRTDLVLLGTENEGAAIQRSQVRSLSRAGYRVGLLTGDDRAPVQARMIAAGATGIVQRSAGLEELRAALHEMAAGNRWLPAGQTLLEELLDGRVTLPVLSPRQQEVLSARARGEQFESIARRLFITRGVAEQHWQVVATKYKDFLLSGSPADLERFLGMDPAVPWVWTPPAPVSRPKPLPMAVDPVSSSLVLT